MKNIIKKFSELTLSKKIQLITALVLTTGLLIAIPVYAWFNRQKKAAEMFKVEYPNSLYINAAHREDKCYLKLDGININGYAKDTITGELLTNNSGEKIKVTKYQYIFSVSGSSTNVFTLQMAHTNNNLFKYTLYEADNYESCAESTVDDLTSYTLSGVDINGSPKTTTISGSNNKDRIIKYEHKANTHNENQLQVIGDNYVKDSASDVYYLRAASAIDVSGSGYKNEDTSNSFPQNSTNYFAKTNDSYYTKTYGDNTNVEIHSVPLYWQGDINVANDSNKNFCKYFVLEVTWDEDEQAIQTEKETDMIYFSVKRVS